MNLDWSKLNRVVVFTGKDKNGNRYLFQFVKDYKSIFGHETIEIGCRKCLNTMFDKYKNYITQMENSKNTPTVAKLKVKYNGIQIRFGSSTFVTNENISQETAVTLLNEHPHGAKLFDVLPVIEKPKAPKAEKPAKKAPRKRKAAKK